MTRFGLNFLFRNQDRAGEARGERERERERERDSFRELERFGRGKDLGWEDEPPGAGQS
jgi:hypothetical protein